MGWLLIPVGLLAWIRGIGYLLPLAVLVSVLQGASVLNLSEPQSYSLSPYYFVCLLIATRMLLFWRTKDWLAPLQGSSGIFFRRLLYFSMWSTFSAFAFPFLFAGTGVYNPRIGIDDQYLNLTPLVWNLGNLSQVVYLWLNVMVLFSAWRYGRKVAMRHRVRLTLYWTGAIVITIGLYQKGCFTFGWPFPFDFFYSNQHALTEWGGASRIFSTFSEPSLFSAFLVIYILYVIIHRGFLWLKTMALLLAGLELIWSEASTGYIAFGLVLGWFLWLRVFKPLFGQGRIKKSGLFAMVGILIIVGAFLSANGMEVIDRVLFQKVDTLSAVHRLAADWQAVQLFLETGGLGVGLGSNRPSSFLTFLLSTVGALGVFLFVSIMRAQSVMLARARQQLSSIAANEIDAAKWAWFGMILSMLIAIPDLASQMLWVMWIVMLISIRSADLTPRFH